MTAEAWNNTASSRQRPLTFQCRITVFQETMILLTEKATGSAIMINWEMITVPLHDNGFQFIGLNNVPLICPLIRFRDSG